MLLSIYCCSGPLLLTASTVQRVEWCFLFNLWGASSLKTTQHLMFILTTPPWSWSFLEQMTKCNLCSRSFFLCLHSLMQGDAVLQLESQTPQWYKQLCFTDRRQRHKRPKVALSSVVLHVCLPAPLKSCGTEPNGDPPGNFKWFFVLCTTTWFWSFTHDGFYLPFSPATTWCKPYSVRTRAQLLLEKPNILCCKNKAEFIGSPKLKFQESLAFLVNSWPVRSCKYRYSWHVLHRANEDCGRPSASFLSILDRKQVYSHH